MKSFEISFEDIIQAETEEKAYDVLLEYLAECVKYRDVEAFKFKEASQ